MCEYCPHPPFLSLHLMFILSCLCHSLPPSLPDLSLSPSGSLRTPLSSLSHSLSSFSLSSDEADDGAGERGAEPQHPPGQHAAAVRGREEQDGRQEGQREAGAATTEEEGGRRGLCWTVCCVFIVKAISCCFHVKYKRDPFTVILHTKSPKQM